MSNNEFLVLERLNQLGDDQRVYRFPNGYGASVRRGEFTYGGKDNLYELAIVKFNSEGPDDFEIVYDTGISEYVIGYLGQEEVYSYLTKIKLLEIRS